MENRERAEELASLTIGKIKPADYEILVDRITAALDEAQSKWVDIEYALVRDETAEREIYVESSDLDAPDVSIAVDHAIEVAIVIGMVIGFVVAAIAWVVITRG